jgi:protein ImuA
MTTSADAREALVASLRRDLSRLEARRPPDERAISTGSPALDRLLPAGGLRPGTLVEYLTASAGSGAGTLALAAARQACREGGALVVLDAGALTRRASEGNHLVRFYPPAAAAWGIDLSAMLVLRPANEADALWAVDQALRCPGVGAVWAACDRLDVRDFRRLQLAAECGGTLGLLLRPARLRGQPTWADVQWEVRSTRQEVRRTKYEVRTKQKTKFRPSSFVLRPSSVLRPWMLHVELVRCRGGTGGKVVILELDERAGIWREVSDEATHTLPVSAPVADPIRPERTRRA